MKTIIKKLIRSAGYELRKVYPEGFRNPYSDISCFLGSNSKPIVFDIGANLGQTIHKFRSLIPGSVIYSFEPDPVTYRKLKQNTCKLKNITLENCGVGKECGLLKFFENSNSDMSSFKEPGVDCWGKTTHETNLPVVTLDTYTQKNFISQIEVLKIDTQGYECEIIQGASNLLKDGKIKIIYFEYIFSNMYLNIQSFGDIYNHLLKNQFVLAGIYDIKAQNKVVGWCDFLFIHKSHLEIALSSE